MIPFITRIALDEPGDLQKRTRLPGFSRSVEDAHQNSRTKSPCTRSTDLMLNMRAGEQSMQLAQSIASSSESPD